MVTKGNIVEEEELLIAPESPETRQDSDSAVETFDSGSEAKTNLDFEADHDTKKVSNEKT